MLLAAPGFREQIGIGEFRTQPWLGGSRIRQFPMPETSWMIHAKQVWRLLERIAWSEYGVLPGGWIREFAFQARRSESVWIRSWAWFRASVTRRARCWGL